MLKFYTYKAWINPGGCSLHLIQLKDDISIIVLVSNNAHRP